MESALIKITLVKRNSTGVEQIGTRRRLSSRSRVYVFDYDWRQRNVQNPAIKSPVGRIQEQKFKVFKSLISAHIIEEDHHAKGSHKYGNCAKFQGKKGVRTFGKLALTSRCCVQEIPQLAQYSRTKIT